MRIFVTTSSNGRCFVLANGISCLGLRHGHAATAYGQGATPEEALAAFFDNFAGELRRSFAGIGRDARIWYPGELPGDC